MNIPYLFIYHLMDVRFICTLDTYEYFDVKENDKNHIRPEDKTFSHIKW